MSRDNAALRERIYSGVIHQDPPTAASREAVGAALQVLENELGTKDVRLAHTHFTPDEFFRRIGHVRRKLFMEAEWHERVRNIAKEAGFDASQIAFDPIRLRVISSGGHHNPLAQAVYYPHRDTWYSHPQGIITWWIPLHDLGEDETFEIYPERFNTAVPNDSEIFDYDDWVRDGWELKIGWQKQTSGVSARYPTVIGQPPRGPAQTVQGQAGDNLLFAGAHFHATRPLENGTTRYSLDFRVVHLGDHDAGRGAPNVDARCRGSALRDYVSGIA
ncbi:MAG: hypothetical protein ACI9KE_003180 [Polyangiales bacterium]|jgi:hypothetical protein